MSATRVALIRGRDRHDKFSQALALSPRQTGFSTLQSLLIKPNVVVTQKPLAATHAGALRAVLDFLHSRYEGPRCRLPAPLQKTWPEDWGAGPDRNRG